MERMAEVSVLFDGSIWVRHAKLAGHGGATAIGICFPSHDDLLSVVFLTPQYRRVVAGTATAEFQVLRLFQSSLLAC